MCKGKTNSDREVFIGMCIVLGFIAFAIVFGISFGWGVSLLVSGGIIMLIGIKEGIGYEKEQKAKNKKEGKVEK